MIVYEEHSATDESHIVRMYADGTHKVELTWPGIAYITNPQWSPRGDLVYADPMLIVDTLGRGDFIPSNPTGTGWQLFEGDTVRLRRGNLRWHADGQHLYIGGIVNHGYDKGGSHAAVDSTELFLIDIHTGVITQRLTRNRIGEAAYVFEVSADGRQLLLSGVPMGTGACIGLMAMSDSSWTPVTGGPIDDSARWASDHETVVYAKVAEAPSVGMTGPHRVYCVRPKCGSKEIPLTTFFSVDPDVFVTPK